MGNRWKHTQEWYDLVINKDNINQIQSDIIKHKKYYLAYYFALNMSHNNHLMQKVVLDSKNLYYCLLFSQNIKNADISAFQKIIINSKNNTYISDFLCLVPSADKKKLFKIIINSNDKNISKYIFKIIKHSVFNINSLKKYIYNDPKPVYLYNLALLLNNKKDISKIENMLLEAKSFKYIKMFAENVKLANINKIEKFVLNNFGPKEIKSFAKYVKKSKLKSFTLLN